MKTMKKILSLVLMVCVIAGLTVGFAHSPASALTYENLSMEAVGVNQASLDASLVTMGNSARITKVMQRAAAGGEITVGFIGGSITYGSGVLGVGQLEERFSHLVAGWFQANFPSATVNHVNCGLPETGSLLGVFRGEQDLFAYNPDLVVIEFAVNDGSSHAAREATEQLIRTALSKPNEPAVMLLMMCTGSGWCEQEDKKVIGNYYDLPMVSYADGMQYIVDHGIATRADFDYDGIHPNTKGNALCGLFINNWLDKVKANMNSTSVVIPAIPSPKYSNDLEHTATRYNYNFTPSTMGSWKPCNDASIYSVFMRGWQVTDGGTQAMTFEVDCKRLYIPYKRGDAYDGVILVSIDGVPRCTSGSGMYDSLNRQAVLPVFQSDTTKRITVSIQLISGTKFAMSGIWIAY